MPPKRLLRSTSFPPDREAVDDSFFDQKLALFLEAHMDCFEIIASTLLECDGYWVRRGFKVKLTKEDKKSLKKDCMPRPEIDLLAFKPKDKLIIAFEAKSYLNSQGVPVKEVMGKTQKGRYKSFTCEPYRKIVLKRLQKDLIDKGMATKTTKIKLGLIAARVKGKGADVNKLADHMKKHRWEFWGPSDIKKKLENLKKLDYENDVAVIVSKILNQ